jgi:hypothetical protein
MDDVALDRHVRLHRVCVSADPPNLLRYGPGGAFVRPVAEAHRPTRHRRTTNDRSADSPAPTCHYDDATHRAILSKPLKV